MDTTLPYIRFNAKDVKMIVNGKERNLPETGAYDPIDLSKLRYDFAGKWKFIPCIVKFHLLK
jgi:hypothetical protein